MQTQENENSPQTMREVFLEYYRPTQSEFDTLFENCIVAVDANVLLDFYRFQEQTREALFRIFAGFKDRFWVPHQAGLEFQRNRLKVRDEQRTQAAKVQIGLNDAHKMLSILLQGNQHHAFLGALHYLGRITELRDSINSEIQKQIDEYPSVSADDPLHERITDLVGVNIGQPYLPEKHSDLLKQAKTRFAAKTPPGYMDSNKEGDSAYGDFIVWRQLIDKAKSTKRPFVFVTRDAKEDWVYKMSGQTIGPRPELIAEMFAEANVRFYLYEPAQFMKYAGDFLKQQVSQESIEEVRDLPTEEVSEEADYPTAGPQESEAIGQTPSDYMRLGAVIAMGGLKPPPGLFITKPPGLFETGEVLKESWRQLLQSQAHQERMAHQEELNKLWASIGIGNPLRDALTTMQSKQSEAILEATSVVAGTVVERKPKSQRKKTDVIAPKPSKTPEADSETNTEPS